MVQVMVDPHWWLWRSFKKSLESHSHPEKRLSYTLVVLVNVSQQQAYWAKSVHFTKQLFNIVQYDHIVAAYIQCIFKNLIVAKSL